MSEARALDLANDARGGLLASVRAIEGQLRAGAADSDSQGSLVMESLDALGSRGFWRMRLCRDLGGLELPITAQMKVLAALAAADTSSAWCTMVMNHAVAVIGSTMPAAAVARVFANGVPECTIVATPGGVATPTEGGFIVSGTWRLATAIRRSQWVHVATFIERDPSRVLPMVIPVGDGTVLDTWHVVGLAGTGSNDFQLNDYFLPSALAGREDRPYGQLRGRRRYDLADVENIESYEHLAFALGVGGRALHELRATLASTGRSAADREVVQAELGQAVLQLRAVEALAEALYQRIDAVACGTGDHLAPEERHLPRALAVAATDLALRCTQLAFHRSGASALRRPSLLDKLLRDMSVAAKHVIVDDTAFATYAQDLIETGQILQSTAVADVSER